MTFPLKRLSQYKVILASQSPRRKELLANMGINFDVIVLPDIDEDYPEKLEADKVAEYLSNKKADAYLHLLKKDALIITADTLVVIDNEISGKPENKEEAFLMIRKLSGKNHRVVSGVTISTIAKRMSFSSITHVWFDELSDEEIYYYIEQYKPFDKAGAYGIQEWIGHIGVSKIEGSYFNVMGLPVQKLYQTLKQF